MKLGHTKAKKSVKYKGQIYTTQDLKIKIIRLKNAPAGLNGLHENGLMKGWLANNKDVGNRNSIAAIGYVGNEIIGWSCAQTPHVEEGMPIDGFRKRELKISSLGVFVKTEYRKKGYGRRLVNAAVKYARSRWTKVTFETSVGNFYRRILKKKKFKRKPGSCLVEPDFWK